MPRTLTFLFFLCLLVTLANCSPIQKPAEVEDKLQTAVQATLADHTEKAPTEQPIGSVTKTPESTHTPIATATLGPGSQRQSEVDGMIQLFVPEGPFLMGSPLGDPDVFPHERPQHNPQLEAFWIDQTEVTNAMYARCVDDGACSPPHSSASNTRTSYFNNPEFNQYPVVWVDWTQAQAYCRWAGRRLPTEAEWEKAARGLDGQYYPWGEEPVAPAMLAEFEDVSTSCARVHYAGCQPARDTAAAGQRPDGASPYGALDMAGNVWEWVSDWYAEDYYENSPADNPTGPASGTQRVLRGGSFAANFSRDLRSAHRYSIEPDQTIYAFGIRCASSNWRDG